MKRQSAYENTGDLQNNGTMAHASPFGTGKKKEISFSINVQSVQMIKTLSSTFFPSVLNFLFILLLITLALISPNHQLSL